MNPNEFSRRILDWFDVHGRKHLPWQQQRTPYRVWISEIMLQQTQVATVIPYYERFMARFPDMRTLAEANLDEVLHHWSGLGYYARARNLHRAALLIRDHYQGEMPLALETLQHLPGIGRSTAGAILALATDQRHAILDGNVKRVLARVQAVPGWPGQTRVLNALWRLSEYYTPDRRVADYTQAMMDLGARVCTRKRPLCTHCPVADGCLAHAQGRETDFPEPRPRRKRPLRSIRILMLRTKTAEVLLEKRPPTGVWGGLWSFPECPLEADVETWCREMLGLQVTNIQAGSVLRHSFSHFQLDMTPLRMTVGNSIPRVMEGERFVWYNIRKPDKRGLAAPVKRLLETLVNDF